LLSNSNLYRYNKEMIAALNIGQGAMKAGGGNKKPAAAAPETPQRTLELPAPPPPQVAAPHVIVDARAGDAAVRLLRKRLLSATGDR
jgi:hypothetical protein